MAGTYLAQCRYCGTTETLPRAGGRPREICPQPRCQRAKNRDNGRKTRGYSGGAHRCTWCGVTRRPSQLTDGVCIGPWADETPCAEQKARAMRFLAVIETPHLRATDDGRLVFLPEPT